MEEYNLRLFLIVTYPQCDWSIALGILIASDEKTQTLTDGFNLLKDCLPKDAIDNDSFHREITQVTM